MISARLVAEDTDFQFWLVTIAFWQHCAEEQDGENKAGQTAVHLAPLVMLTGCLHKYNLNPENPFVKQNLSPIQIVIPRSNIKNTSGARLRPSLSNIETFH